VVNGMRITRSTACAAGLLAALTMKLAAAQATQRPNPSVLASDADIRKILAERVDAIAGQEDGIGIIVGVIGPEQRRVVSYGHLDKASSRTLDGDTCFEIGSVTKVFTALLLADMVRKEEVALADPVAKYLPAAVKVPQRNGRPITLLDLVTHTSGLSFMPDESAGSNDSSASKDSRARFYEFLARYQLSRDSSTEWDYSNIGYWLLSEALASRAAADYETLLRTRVIAQLKLTRTAFSPSPTMKANFAIGHDAALQPSPSLSNVPIYKDMLAAGGLVSTANDLLTFLAATMGYERSPLSQAMAIMLGTRRPMPQRGEAQALGWVVIGEGDDQLVAHDGGTWGYASSVVWDPKRRIGVVVLSNQAAAVDDIARHLLRPGVPLAKPAMKHTEIAVDPAVLDTYAGRYEAPGEGVFIISRERDFLTIQPPAEWGLPKLRLRPESLHDFFASELPLRVTFQTDGNGRVKGLLVHPPRGQKAVPANRISSDK
jgi:D-alanyl-D-alanine-carboxypeptidase/D-alanyl-D-alanine-endopeptidase